MADYINDAKRRSVVEKMWLNYHNNSLLEKALITNVLRCSHMAALISAVAFLTFFRRSTRNSFLPGNLTPAFCPLWYARAFAVMADTSLGDISISDGHVVFKLQYLETYTF